MVRLGAEWLAGYRLHSGLIHRSGSRNVRCEATAYDTVDLSISDEFLETDWLEEYVSDRRRFSGRLSAAKPWDLLDTVYYILWFHTR